MEDTTRWFCVVCMVGRAMPLPFHVVMPKILKCAALCGKRDCVPVIKLVVWLAVRDFPGLPERSYVVPRVVIKGLQEKPEGETRRCRSASSEDGGRGKHRETRAALINERRKSLFLGGTELCQLLCLHLVNPPLAPHI